MDDLGDFLRCELSEDVIIAAVTETLFAQIMIVDMVGRWLLDARHLAGEGLKSR